MLKISERGDTIIEVLIVLTVLGSAFGIAYATSNSSLQAARNAQEHTAALQYVSSQIEHMRAYSNSSAISTGTNIFDNMGAQFCMNPSTGALVMPYAASDCTVSGTVGYRLSIIQTATELFRIDVDWVGVGALGNQKEQLFYKLHRP